MPKFSKISHDRLGTCHPHLIKIFNRVVADYDCSILCGHRGEERQNAAFNATPKRSHVRWPDGKHNALPSDAVDVAPYPVDWSNLKRFYLFAGYVIGRAAEMGIPLRWGGDWDTDWDLDDQHFNDLVHFEIRPGQ